jgi:protein ImuB
MERFLCLALPHWSTDRVARRIAPTAGATSRRPARPPAIVLTTRARGGGSAPVVARCCERARAAGVTLGAAVALARGLLLHDALHVEPHDPEGDAAALAALAHAAQRFSPRVAVDAPHEVGRRARAAGRAHGAAARDALLLEIGGSLRLFHGERALATAALEWLAGFGLQARAGVASTIGAAHALAHFAAPRAVARRAAARDGAAKHMARAAPGAEREAIAPLPLEALRLCDDTVEALHELGLATIGDVLALPRHEVPARLGDELLLRLDQALGRAPEGLARVAPPLVFESSRTFAGALESRVALARVVRELVDELSAALAHEEHVCARLELRLWPCDAASDAPPLALVRHASRARRDARLLWTLFEHELERAPIGFGVERVQLIAGNATPAHESEHALFAGLADTGDGLGRREHDAAHASELAALVDVLKGRLGRSAASAADLCADVRSECSVTARALDAPPRAGRSFAAVLARPRPTHLFDAPQPIEVLAVDGRPQQFTADGHPFEVVHADGPERLALPWWPSAPQSRAAPSPALLAAPDFDGARAFAPTELRHQRDLFRVRTSDGRLVWLVRALVIHVALGDAACDLDARLLELDRAGRVHRARAHDVAFAWFRHGEWS